jgi:hypothetical protein
VISLNWIIVLPEDLTAEQFDDWYLNVHTKYAKAGEGMMRYAINRALSQQPAQAEGGVFRVAQEWWDDWDSMDSCWNGPTGHVLLGDGLVNMGLDPGTLPVIAITQDERLPVTTRAPFSVDHRGYVGRPDGTITRWFAMGTTDDPPALAAWYRDTFADLGQAAQVREHVFGTTVGRTLKVGLRSSLPSDTQEAYDWVQELWFESNDEARAFLAGDAFGGLWSQLRDRSGAVRSVLVRGQEMLVQNDALPHRDD